MTEIHERRTSIGFLFAVALPAALGTICAILIAVYTLVWASSNIDRATAERQDIVARVALDRMRKEISHNQESVTVWDEAVRKTSIEYDAEWIDGNLGRWMHDYFGHDELYIVDTRNAPIYAFAREIRQEPTYFETVASVAVPLAENLRTMLRQGMEPDKDRREQTVGKQDYAFVNGHPAIVSLKPIVSDSGDIEQAPGEEFLHISVRYMDGSSLSELASVYQFAAPAFVRQFAAGAGFGHADLTSGAGDTIGYIQWRSDAPGSQFLNSIWPLVAGAAGLLAVAVVTALVALHRKSVNAAEHRDRIRFLAHHDPLTSLPNRYSFELDLDTALAGDEKRPIPLAVMYLDLDRFKKVNDTLGHGEGDKVILEATRRVRTLLGEGDKLYRIGGDEFVIIARSVDHGAAQALATAIVAAIQNPFELGHNTAHIGVSIGIAFAPEHADNRPALVRKADLALYHAKALGRSQHAFYSQHMDALIADTARLEKDLRVELDTCENLKVYYQPKVAGDTGRMVGVEALVRWHHPDRGLLSPDLFIAIAEDSDLIASIGFFVLERACSDARDWPIDTIAVNVSPSQLRDPAFPLKVAGILDKTGLPPSKLELEITESAVMQDRESCAKAIAALRTLGVRIALDDFGIGFSSLGRLQEIGADRIKIDAMFVAGVGKSTGDEAIIRAITQLGHARGLSITAEGVETAAQRDFLVASGCDELQGYLYSQAVPGEDIWRMLQHSPQGPLRKAV